MTRMNPHNRSLQSLVVMLPLLIAVLPSVGAGFFTRLLADDYCHIARTQEIGVIANVVETYQTWVGRVTQAMGMYLVTALPTPLLAIFPALVMIGWAAAVAWLLHEIAVWSRITLSRTTLATGTLAIVGAGVAGTLSPQSWYWISGLFAYAFALLPATIALAIVVRAARVERARGWMIIGGALASFAAATTSETSAAMVITAWTLSIVAAGRSRAARAVLIAALVGAVVGFVIVLAAPGNTARQTFFARTTDPIALATQTATNTVAFLVIGVRHAALLLTIALSAGLVVRAGLDHANRRRLRRLAGAGIAIGLVVIAAGVAPSIYATSLPPPGRAYVLYQAVMVAIAVCVGMLIGTRPPRLSPRLVQGVIAVLLLAFVVQSISGAWPTLRTLAQQAAEWDARDRVIREAARTPSPVVVAPFTIDFAQAIGLDTVSADPSTQINRCAARYYEVESLATR